MKKEKDLYVCEECGSTSIQTQAWIDPNTYKYIDTTGIDRYDNWCDECMENIYFCKKSEFVERMETWWNNADLHTMEKVTGFQQDDFSPENDSHDFVNACQVWWNKKSYDKKRVIWKAHNLEE